MSWEVQRDGKYNEMGSTLMLENTTRGPIVRAKNFREICIGVGKHCIIWKYNAMAFLLCKSRFI